MRVRKLLKGAVDTPSLGVSKTRWEWDFEQHDVVEDVPAHHRGFQLDEF